MSLDPKYYCSFCKKFEDLKPMDVCEPCGIVKYCSPKCRKEDKINHEKICSDIQNQLKELILFKRSSSRL